MIQAAGYRWYAAGEIIAWNTAGPLDYSASFAVQGWMGSAPHRAIVVSDDYNYVGFGLAIADDGTRYWAGVYLRGPDRTGGYARTGSFSKANLNATWARGKIRWAGGDLRLQVLTAGHRYFQIGRRLAGGTVGEPRHHHSDVHHQVVAPRRGLRVPGARARPQRELGILGDQADRDLLTARSLRAGRW